MSQGMSSTEEHYRTDKRLHARIDLHTRFSVNPYGWYRWVFDQFDLRGPCRILEIACGTGRLWNENAYCIHPSWRLVLTDRSEAILRGARKNLAEFGGTFQFALADLQAVPLEDASLDAVIANHVLYYAPDKSRVFAEIRRVLKPGGKVYATTVGRNHMKELRDLAGRFDPGLKLGNDAESFTLENGLSQMTEAFSSVTLSRYDDALEVSEPEPLVSYVLSIASADYDRRAEFLRFVERHLASLGGTMHITKDSGIFHAYRP
jgi:SAM-dependent methyltransferase